MAKEKFERTKPHVNVGTIGHVQTLEDTSGQLTATDAGSDINGNPAPSSVVNFNSPASTTLETATVAFPIDTDFVFDPSSSGPAVSIDFQLDVLSTMISGTSEVDITLAIVQGEPFVVSRSGSTPGVDGTEAGWTTLGQSRLRADDFIAVDGGPERPDFGQSFQFGYAFSAEYSTTAMTVALGLDNMEVEITTVPEPSSIMLALAMGAALWWRRW